MRTRSAPPLPPGTPKPRRHPWRSLRRAASWHRRKLAALAAVTTVLSGLAAVAPPAPPSGAVVQTTRALPAGTVLRPDDLQSVAVATDVVPDEAVPNVDAVVGRRLAGAATRGEIVTDVDLVSPRAVSDSAHVLAPVRLADADTVGLLRPGDVVDVLGADNDTGKVATVASRARVVTIPPPTSDVAGSETGALVVMEIDRASVPVLTHALSSSRLTVVWS